MKIMEQDQSYRYFTVALTRWFEKNKDKAPQKLLSINSGISVPNVSKHLSPKRKKPIPYEAQVKYANACGFDYFSFLQKGKQILTAGFSLIENKTAVAVNGEVAAFSDEIIKKHQIVVTGFSDRERALRINQKMVEVEKRKPSKLEDIEEQLDGFLAITPSVEESEVLGNGTRGGS